MAGPEHRRSEIDPSLSAVLFNQVAGILTQELTGLDNRQRFHLKGAGGFLHSVHLAMQIVDFGHQTEGRESLETYKSRRDIVIRVLYPLLFSGEETSCQLAREEKITLQKTIILYRDILYQICEGKTLFSFQVDRLPEIRALFTAMSDQQLSMS